MDITGTQELEATPQVIWSMLLNPSVLERIIPGLKTLTPIGDHEYEALSEIKMGPVKGAFKGHLNITDQVNGKSCKVILSQESKMGNAAAEISMELRERENGMTEIIYNGEAKLAGTLARMGQRIVGGVVKTLARQFFEGLENELKTT
jgi:carbon monoxide dehydrogenase subunit G